MSILKELNTALSALDISIETGVFFDKAPEKYIVLTPLSDTFDLHADNLPGVDIQEVRISLFVKGNYTALKNRLVRLLLQNGFTVTGRMYNGCETDTGYHHYTVDVAQYYETEE